MSVRVYLVEPNLRPWSRWLGDISVSTLQARKFLKETTIYTAPDQHLVLIHGADADKREEDRQRYLTLVPALQERLWLLYYNGAGHQHARPADLPDHIHHLVYPIADQLGDAEQKCFRRAVAALGAGEITRASDLWHALYPPDNTDAVALLALARAADRPGVKEAIQALNRQATDDTGVIYEAYVQYSVAAGLFTDQGSWPYLRWKDTLDRNAFDDLAKELQRVLGLVPD